jgi:hypothetical protein
MICLVTLSGKSIVSFLSSIAVTVPWPYVGWEMWSPTMYLLTYSTAASPLAGVFGPVIFLDPVDFRAEARGWRAFAIFFALMLDIAKKWEQTQHFSSCRTSTLAASLRLSLLRHAGLLGPRALGHAGSANLQAPLGRAFKSPQAVCFASAWDAS